MADLRTKKLGYVELNVTDLARSLPYYREIVGLQFVEFGAGGEARLRCSDDHYNVVLRPAAQAGFSRCGWELFDERQFEILHEALDDHGVNWEAVSATECAERLLRRATRFAIPHLNATWEYYLPTDELAEGCFESSVADILRLGHVVFHAEDYDSTLRFFVDVLNYRVSDAVGEMVTLMRPFGSPFHHGVGIARTGRNGFHHLNFMVSNIDDVGKGIHRLNKAGSPIVYGPGRHPASSSVFLYFLDPDGVTLEYSFGMEEFEDKGAREHRVFPLAPESSDSWGSPLDPRMAQGGTIEIHDVVNRRSSELTGSGSIS